MRDDQVILPEKPVEDLDELIAFLEHREDGLAELPPGFREMAAFRPLLVMPDDLTPLRDRLIADGRRQVDAAKARGDALLALRFPVTPELRRLAEWIRGRAAVSSSLMIPAALPPKFLKILSLYYEGWGSLVQQVLGEDSIAIRQAT